MRISDWSSDVCSSDLAVLDYLDRTDPEAARTARERYGCLMPWARDPADYGRVALDPGFERCERAVLAALRDLLDSRSEYILRDGRTEERRVGNECVSTGKSRGSLCK